MDGIIYEQIFLNSKFECRNPKQIRISKAPMTETDVILKAGVFSFGSFEFRSLEFISSFGFRASDFDQRHGS